MPSIQIPASKPDTWHERSEWLRYASTLFRYYSRSSRYALRFVHDPSMIAAVDVNHHRVFLNPEFPTPPDDLLEFVRARPGSHREGVILYLQAFLAHEAAHVLYSSRKPDGLLGAVWNAIEDERIERLMARAHPSLATAFTHIGDVFWTRRLANLDRQPLEGVLYWRWSKDHPELVWTCTDEPTWDRVRPHVEAAWTEPDPERVVDHARAILKELGCDETAPIPVELAGPEVSCPADLPDRTDADRRAPTDQAHQARTKATHTDEEDDASPGTGEQVQPPDAPQVMPTDPDHHRARELQREIEVNARALGTALALPATPSTRISHQNRGRFDYGRYAQGAQRPFRVAHQPTRRKMPNITVLHDISGSMGAVSDPTSNQFAAVRATMMMQRACECARTPFRLIAFNDMPEVLVEPGSDPEQARAAIACLDSRGGTNLAPALAKALIEPWPSRARALRTHVILIYCDGGITPADAEECRALAQQNASSFVLPVLIGASVSRAAFEAAFGRAMSVPDATTLAARLRAWVATYLV